MPFLTKLFNFTLACIIFASWISSYNNVIFSQEKRKKPEAIKIDKQTNTFRPDFRDKDIAEFLKLMSALIGLNLVIDDRVKGRITVISPERIPVKDAFQYLTTILQVRGYGIIKEGTILRVVTLKDALASSQLIVYSNTPWLEITEAELDLLQESNEIQGGVSIKKKIQNQRLMTQIVEIEHVKASKLVGTLKRLTNKSTEIIPFEEEGLSKIIITGGPLEVNRLVKLLTFLDVKEEILGLDIEEEELISFGTFHYYRLENIDADSLVSTLNKLSVPENYGELFELGGNKTTRKVVTPVNETINSRKRNRNTRNKRQEEAKLKYKRLSLVAHKDTNAILFVGTKKEFQQVLKMIKRLDRVRDQVLLEVLIAEVSVDNGFSLGVDFEALVSSVSSLASASSATITSLISGGGAAGAQLALLAAPLIDVLSFAASSRDLTILSAPQILAVDNEEAEINVGEDIAIPRTTINGTSGVTSTDFTFEQSGVKLKFTPRISKNKVILLDIYQEVKTIIGSIQDVSAANPPNFLTRELKTKIRVGNNQTIIIGGLISNEVTESVSKVPLLGDIPILGYLFKRKSRSNNRRNLLIFITPHVISTRNEANQITQDFKKLYEKKFYEMHDIKKPNLKKSSEK